MPGLELGIAEQFTAREKTPYVELDQKGGPRAFRQREHPRVALQRETARVILGAVAVALFSKSPGLAVRAAWVMLREDAQ